MGLMIFGAFAVGLRAANLETDVEKLWVEGKTLIYYLSVYALCVCVCVFGCQMQGLVLIWIMHVRKGIGWFRLEEDWVGGCC